MYKLIDSASFFSQEEPSITILNPGNIRGLIKEAADSRIQEYVKNIVPIPGKMYLHINAMGAGEYYGSNKNGDYFPEGNLLNYYMTFVTSPAHVFRHHINKDPAKAIGHVVFAVYNSRMRRVELIAEVSKELGSDVEAKIARGEYPSTSMACKTPYDVCSICGKRAHTRQEYCVHLSTQLNKVLPDGRKVMALNEGPLKFFDISIVIKPADVTSSVLEKVASVAESISSAELAEDSGLKEETIKEAALKKFSELVKVIPDSGQVLSAHDAVLSRALQTTQELPDHVLHKLSLFEFEEVLLGLAEAGVSPSLPSLGEILARNVYKEHGVGLGKILGEIAKLHLLTGSYNPESFFDAEDLVEKQASFSVSSLINPYKGQCSILPEFLEKRAEKGLLPYVVHTRDNPFTNHPYAQPEPGLPHQFHSPEVYKNPYTEVGPPMDLDNLISLGGLVLVAKLYLNKLIGLKNSAKILLEKSADSMLVNEVKAPDTSTTEGMFPSPDPARLAIKALRTINKYSVNDPRVATATDLAKASLLIHNTLNS